MSRRHTVFKTIELKNLAGVVTNVLNETLYSEVFDSKTVDVFGLILDVTNAVGLTAELVVEVKTQSSAWSKLVFDTAIALASNDSVNVRMETPPFEKFRVKLLWTAGTADVVLNFSGKSIGA